MVVVRFILEILGFCLLASLVVMSVLVWRKLRAYTKVLGRVDDVTDRLMAGYQPKDTGLRPSRPPQGYGAIPPHRATGQAQDGKTEG